MIYQNDRAMDDLTIELMLSRVKHSATCFESMTHRFIWECSCGEQEVGFATIELAQTGARRHMAGKVLEVIADWLQREETSEDVAEEIESHHINSMARTDEYITCSCGEWFDTPAASYWHFHLASVGLRALAKGLRPAPPESAPPA